MCNLDLSFLDDTNPIFSAVGDLPDWFYRLALPAEMLPWFVIRGLTASALTNYLVSRGHRPRLPRAA
eukprot:11983294-Alexandrium_andersonii.AAC.1